MRVILLSLTFAIAVLAAVVTAFALDPSRVPDTRPFCSGGGTEFGTRPPNPNCYGAPRADGLTGSPVQPAAVFVIVLGVGLLLVGPGRWTKGSG